MAGIDGFERYGATKGEKMKSFSRPCIFLLKQMTWLNIPKEALAIANTQVGWCIEMLNLNESDYGPEDYRRRKLGTRIFKGT